MRVAALYDIHGNLPALEAVLRDVEREMVDRLIVGGDALLGPMPRETLECVLGLDVQVAECPCLGDKIAMAERADSAQERG